jgi:uncharacterized repeat protein (TIGR02543 family)
MFFIFIWRWISMASKTLTMTNSWCSGTLTTSQTLSSDKRSATITATLKLWRNDGRTTYNYNDSNNFWVTIDGTTTYFTITSVAGTSGVSKSASKSVSINVDGTKNVSVSCGGSLTGTTFAISGTQSLTHTVTGGAKASYTVTYNANGGTGTMSTDTIQYGNSYTTKTNTFTRSGYRWIGWNEAANGSGTDWTDWVGKAWTWTYTKNITLYAQWEIATCTITYNANGGIGAPNPQTVTIGGTLTLSSTQPTRSGYVFMGWHTSSTSTTANYVAGSAYTFSSDTVLYAVWRSEASLANRYVMKFYKNGNVQVYDFVETDDSKFRFLKTGLMKTEQMIKSNG